MIKKIFILLVFLPIFGTVTPEFVQGKDTVYLNNFVQSSSHTGGYGSDGVSGSDGVDGEDGMDGTPGQPGKDVSSGESRAVIELSNSVDGKTVPKTDVHIDTNGTGEAHVYFDTTSDTTDTNPSSTSTNVAETDTSTSNAPLDEAQQSSLRSIVAALQKIIEHYVNLLF